MTDQTKEPIHNSNEPIQDSIAPMNPNNNILELGEIRLSSWDCNMKELLGALRLLLEDELVREYLGVLKEKKVLSGRPYV